MTTATKPLQVIEKSYKWLLEGKDARFHILYGGASSGKSKTLSLYMLVEKLYREPGIGILVLRKTRPAVKKSCYRGIKEWLTLIGRPYQENKSDLVITAPNGSFMQFEGLDDVEKLKSIEGINYVWCEEATEFTEKELMQLSIRCRHKNPYGLNQIFLTFNPVDPFGNAWLKALTDMKPESEQYGEGRWLGHKVRVMSMTIDDNPFLAQEERDTIESLADVDDEYHKIYRLGIWATPTQIIYKNWDIVQKMPEKYTQRVWGIDFGYATNPAALVEIRFVSMDEVYIHEHIYQTHLTNPEFIELMKPIVPKNEQVIADSAEPKSIQEIRNAGFNIFGAIKGPDSVQFGIRTLQFVKQHITAESTNVIEEIRGYKWQVDSEGNVKSPPKPVAIKDHAMDANRYAITKIKGLVKAGLDFAGPEKKVMDVHDRLFGDDGWDEI